MATSQVELDKFREWREENVTSAIEIITHEVMEKFGITNKEMAKAVVWTVILGYEGLDTNQHSAMISHIALNRMTEKGANGSDSNSQEGRV